MEMAVRLAAERRRPGSLLPGHVPEDEAHLGDLVLERLVHLGPVVLLLLDPPHLAVHHPRHRHLLPPMKNVLVSQLLPLHCNPFLSFLPSRTVYCSDLRRREGDKEEEINLACVVFEHWK
ncbi:hypothetical protein PR202_gb09735 [Eleusine coracana subsp. coracana]|uniref:Uncharacterized protein n=1 Tax=Eleusine coracana subsp. coracana TaxID=191504 RepID=A0AAV5EI43_ELECO|nr:hypothetical protein PR202_gb09735 [Eleusine coracana subsp. coracana]